MEIVLDDIKEGMPGITPIEGADLHENCITMLHRCGHPSPAIMPLMGISEENVVLRWNDIHTEQMERTYADYQVNTERSAIAISALLAKELTGLSIIMRSRKGTGFDYYLGKTDDAFYEPSARLEVSGIEKESPTNTIESRFKQKIEQIAVSDSTTLPAYISVVEFSTPKTYFDTKEII